MREAENRFDPSSGLSRAQSAGLTMLRVFIGWHFLYEGIIKWADPEWSARQFLEGSTWILSGLFGWFAENSVLLAAVDLLNQAGLVVIGTALIAGLLTRPAAIAGMVMLGLYYLAHPPLFDGMMMGAAGDQYLLIDKNLIEMAGLYLVFVFNAGRIYGVDALIRNRR